MIQRLLCYLLVAVMHPVPVIAETDAALPADQSISFSIEAVREVHVGEPFDYQVRVLYRPDQVTPDFPALIRDIRFVPFEQLHLSRPRIRTVDHGDVQEYTLTYPLQGVNVIPHQPYALDPVTLQWKQPNGETASQTVQPEPVMITGYYGEQVFGQTFQPPQPAIDDHYRFKQAGLILLMLLGLVYGVTRIRHAGALRAHSVTTRAEQMRERFGQIEGNPREKLLAYERILLTLLFYYRQFSARQFWQTGTAGAGIDLQGLKLRLQQAYRVPEPDAAAVMDMRDSIGTIFETLDEQAQAERQAQLDMLHGTWCQRLRAKKWTFVRGMLGLSVSVLLLVMLMWPSLWRDPDVQLYNGWIERLPVRLFDSTMDSKLSSMDVELLVQISEQQDILQQLASDAIKSAYLYNFGTIIAKAYVAIIAAEDRMEEEFGENETGGNRPSFEFPKQLLANAVRLAPLQEDSRRNLEIAIMLREAEKKDEESGQVQGELGPPLPGFSRDLSPVLF